MPGFGSGPLDIVVRTAIIYVAVVFGLRLGGKREVGQLSIIDLVALLLLSNAVQNAMVGDDTSILGGLIAAGVILLLARGLDMGIRRYRVVRKLVIGEPRILVSHGAIIARALREEDVSMDELTEALHEHGLEDMKDVKLAYLEVDGSVSVIPEPDAEDRFQPGAGSGARRAGRIPRRASRHRGQTANADGGSNGTEPKAAASAATTEPKPATNPATKPKRSKP